MRTIIFSALQVAYWMAFYTMLTVLKDERALFASLAVTLAVSMVTAAVFLVKRDA